MDKSLSHPFSEATDCKPCLSKSFDPIAWADHSYRARSAHGLQIGPATTLVIPRLAIFQLVFSYFRRFQAPNVKPGEDNIENSENTVLFLVSSFQYILASVVLSAGPPFRKPMSSNSGRSFTNYLCFRGLSIADSSPEPFLAVLLIHLVFSSYMLFMPSTWIKQLMQLTYLSKHFATWLLGLIFGSFLFAWLAERKLFPQLARIIGHMNVIMRPGHHKQRRQYKMLLEGMNA